jgi:hypothetical protein
MNVWKDCGYARRAGEQGVTPSASVLVGTVSVAQKHSASQQRQCRNRSVRTVQPMMPAVLVCSRILPGNSSPLTLKTMTPVY